jgi:hypothetical protein
MPRAADPREVEHLHDMRIAAKRLRYILEISEACFGPYAAAAAKRAKDVQDLLGEIHDADVALPRLADHESQALAADVAAVRGRAPDAKDLDPALAADGPHADVYRGLAAMATYHRARRELLFSRFLTLWQELGREASARAWSSPSPSARPHPTARTGPHRRAPTARAPRPPLPRPPRSHDRAAHAGAHLRHPARRAGGRAPRSVDLDDPSLYTSREISWLSFNDRVLQLTEDPSVPLMERVKFAAIYTSNLDEFFMIRVAGVHDQIDAGVNTRGRDGRTPNELLDAMREEIAAQGRRQTAVIDRALRPALEEHGVRILAWSQTTAEQRAELEPASTGRSSPSSRRWPSGSGARSPTSPTSRSAWRSSSATR